MPIQLRRIAITAALAVLIAISIPIFVHRRSFDVAVYRWTNDQNAENAAVLQRELTNNRRSVLRFEFGAGCVVFLLLNTGWFLANRLKRRVSHP